VRDEHEALAFTQRDQDLVACACGRAGDGHVS
jgi:hypothetical protein